MINVTREGMSFEYSCYPYVLFSLLYSTTPPLMPRNKGNANKSIEKYNNVIGRTCSEEMEKYIK